MIAKSHPAVWTPLGVVSKALEGTRGRDNCRTGRRAARTCCGLRRKRVKERTWKAADGKQPEGGEGERK